MLGTPSTAALTWSTACAGITAPAGTLAVRPRPPRLCVLYLLRKPAHRPCSGNTPNYLDNVNSATLESGVNCSQFSVCTVCFPGGKHDGGVPLINGRCTGYCSHLGYCGISEVYRTGGTDCTQESALCTNPCPNAFPHVAYEGRICYTLASYASAGSGPCESWCTNDATFGAGCGDPSSKMCAIDSTNCFDPQPTIDTWSAYSTAAAKAVKDEGVVQKLCDEPNVCESWREANSCGRRRLVHTTVDIAGPVAPR